MAQLLQPKDVTFPSSLPSKDNSPTSRAKETNVRVGTVFPGFPHQSFGTTTMTLVVKTKGTSMCELELVVVVVLVNDEPTTILVLVIGYNTFEAKKKNSVIKHTTNSVLSIFCADELCGNAK